MSSWLTKLFRRAVRWLWPAALLALTPKCVLCLLAYAGIGTALGLGGPEICGVASGTMSPWVSSFVLVGVTVGVIVHYTRRHKDTPRVHNSEETASIHNK
jgi:hypothetical protein